MMRYEIDYITLYNRNEILAYLRTSRDGGLFCAQHGTTVSVGIYTDAYPHVTDGLFRDVLTREFDSARAAHYHARLLVEAANRVLRDAYWLEDA